MGGRRTRGRKVHVLNRRAWRDVTKFWREWLIGVRALAASLSKAHLFRYDASTLLKHRLELTRCFTQAALACAACIFTACATQGVEHRHLGEQRYHFRCQTGLASCLSHVSDVCRDTSYDVLRARDRRHFTGVEPAEREQRSSEAVIECRARGTPLFDEDDLLKPLATEPQRATPPEHQPRTLLCTPGTTQPCVGVGACAGGQACLADGSGYGACQCAEAPTPADTPPPTNSETHKAPTPTMPTVPAGTDAPRSP